MNEDYTAVIVVGLALASLFILIGFLSKYWPDEPEPPDAGPNMGE